MVVAGSQKSAQLSSGQINDGRERENGSHIYVHIYVYIYIL